MAPIRTRTGQRAFLIGSLLVAPQVMAAEYRDDWDFTGYLSSASSNGGSINSSLVASVGIVKFDGKFSYVLDASIQRYSERILVRRDTGMVPTEVDEVQVVDPDGLGFTARSLPGPSSAAFTVNYQTNQPVFYWLQIRNETDKSSNLQYINQLTVGVGYDLYQSATEMMDVEFGVGYRGLSQREGENIDEEMATLAFSYRNMLGRRTEITTLARYDHGDLFHQSSVKFGLHFWMTENLAIALVNETQRYGKELIRPDYVGNGSNSLTSFNIVFRNGTQ